MKKVLGLVGSPRKGGNTDLLIQEVLLGAREAAAGTDLIYLADRDIRECDGCHACWRGKPCSKRDDMAGIYQAIAGSDILVFGTPVYWYGPTALMKLLIDRFVYFNCPENRSRVRGKTAAAVIPFEETERETARPVVDFFSKSLAYLEMRLCDPLLVPGLSKKGEVSGQNAVMEQAHQMGSRLITGWNLMD